MNSALLQLLRCPRDCGPLLVNLTKAEHRTNGNQQAAPGGALRCLACGCEIPIEAGIPRFVTREHNDLCALQQSEMEVRDRDYRPACEEIRRRLEPADVPEFDAVRAALGDCRGLRVLDAGCGTGKFSPAIRNANFFLGVDLSWEGLRHFQKPARAACVLIQADATRLPVASGLFDVALSCQVLSHLPTLDLRSRLVDEMARVLNPGGRLILTAMHYSFRYRDRHRPQEGVEGCSYFHRFEAEELRGLLSARFNVLSLRGYWIYLPKTYRLFVALGKWKAYSDRLLRSLPLSLTYGKYLLAVCTPKS